MNKHCFDFKVMSKFWIRLTFLIIFCVERVIHFSVSEGKWMIELGSFKTGRFPNEEISLSINVLPTAITVCAGLVILISLTCLFWKRSSFIRSGLSLCWLGALGNLSDRLIHGFVVDNFQFILPGNMFFTFNIPDIFLITGALLMLWDLLHINPLD